MTSMSPDAGLSPGGASTVGAIGAAAGPAVGGVHTADVLAFTGTGPGTFYLAIIGFASVIAGFFATRVARRKPAVAQAPVNGLADLSPLADRMRA
jgi:hypothetical protein